jgi:methylmalonyl-CoA mutase C-terminal domain/subunit
VGLSVLSGAHMHLFPRVVELLAQQGAGHVLVTGGGIIPPEDMSLLASRGTGKLFGPGATLKELVEYIRAEVGRRRAAARSN